MHALARAQLRAVGTTSHMFVVDAQSTEYVDCSDVELTYYPDLVRDVRDRLDRLALWVLPAALDATRSPRRCRRAG